MSRHLWDDLKVPVWELWRQCSSDHTHYWLLACRSGGMWELETEISAIKSASPDSYGLWIGLANTSLTYWTPPCEWWGGTNGRMVASPVLASGELTAEVQLHCRPFTMTGMVEDIWGDEEHFRVDLTTGTELTWNWQVDDKAAR